MADDRQGMSREEAGRKGGKTTREKHGSEFYSEIGSEQGKEDNPGNFANRSKRKRSGKRVARVVKAAEVARTAPRASRRGADHPLPTAWFVLGLPQQLNKPTVRGPDNWFAGEVWIDAVADGHRAPRR